MSRSIVVCLLAAGLAALAGCHTCSRLDFTANRPGCNGCGDGAVPSRFRPVPQPQPPPRLHRLPPGQPPIAHNGGNVPAQHLTPAPAPGQRADNGEGRAEPAPFPPSPGDEAPVPSRAFLLPPRRSGTEAPRTMPRENDEPPPVANVPGPRTREKRDDLNDLLNLKQAVADVASGLRPDERETQWLKKKGYRAVLYLRPPLTDTREQKRLTEKQGLKFLTLEAAPARLDAKLYEQFVQLVDDSENHPLYVYDEGTGVAGGLWYLYFHLHKRYTDEEARAEAKRLGLDFASDVEEHKTMVLAIQTFVKDYKP